MANSIKLLGITKKAGRLEIGEESAGMAARAKKMCIRDSFQTRDGAGKFRGKTVEYVLLSVGKREILNGNHRRSLLFRCV